MMKNKTAFFVMITMCMLSLFGCMKDVLPEPITTTKFRSIMEEQGLSVHDQTKSAEDSSYQEIFVAVDEKKYSFEYYSMKNEKAATNVYDYAVKNLNATYQDNASASIEENKEDIQAIYEVTAEDYYCKVIRNENTVLYVTAYSDYKKEAETLLETLGY